MAQTYEEGSCVDSFYGVFQNLLGQLGVLRFAMDVSDSTISVSSLGDRIFVTDHRLVYICLGIIKVSFSMCITQSAVQLSAE